MAPRSAREPDNGDPAAQSSVGEPDSGVVSLAPSSTREQMSHSGHGTPRCVVLELPASVAASGSGTREQTSYSGRGAQSCIERVPASVAASSSGTRERKSLAGLGAQGCVVLQQVTASVAAVGSTGEQESLSGLGVQTVDLQQATASVAPRSAREQVSEPEGGAQIGVHHQGEQHQASEVGFERSDREACDDAGSRGPPTVASHDGRKRDENSVDIEVDSDIQINPYVEGQMPLDVSEGSDAQGASEVPLDVSEAPDAQGTSEDVINQRSEPADLLGMRSPDSRETQDAERRQKREAAQQKREWVRRQIERRRQALEKAKAPPPLLMGKPAPFCWRCGAYGHLITDCPLPEPPKSVPQDCIGCGQPGHWLQECDISHDWFSSLEQEDYCGFLTKPTDSFCWRCKSSDHATPKCPQAPVVQGPQQA